MITTATVTLATGNGRGFDGHMARRPTGKAPGIVVLSEMFGLNDPMREVADGYARRGFAVIVPNLFWRSENSQGLAYDGPEREIATARLEAFDRDVGGDDIRTAVDWLRSQPFSTGKVGALGFCAGGTMAFVAAARAGVDAAASLYGVGISDHLGEIDAVRCPMQIHYASNDRFVPRSEMDTVANGVRGHPTIEVYFYAAGHSFANPVRPNYDAEAAKLAWSRIDGMLEAMR